MFVLEILAGIAIGFVLGMIPNLHINLVGYVFSAMGIFFFFRNHFYFFFALCVSQTLTNILPSLFFYTQTQDTLISPFLGQQHSTTTATKESALLCFFGFLFGALFSVLFLPIFYLLYLLFSDFYFLIFFVLLCVLLFLIFQEKHVLSCCIVFAIIVFAGCLGIFTLKFNFFFREPLIPCIFGLFAFPNILLILFSRTTTDRTSSTPVQEEKTNLKDIASFSFLGTLFSCFVAIFPSLSPGLAMSFSSFFQKDFSKTKTLVIFSSILSSVILIYFFLSTVFNKHRIGFLALLAEQQITSVFFFPDVLKLVFSFILIVSLTVFLCFYFLDSIFVFLNSFDKKQVLFIISIFSIFLIFIFSGIAGFFLLLISTAIGFLPIVYNKNRLALMSYLILPTILFFVWYFYGRLEN